VAKVNVCMNLFTFSTPNQFYYGIVVNGTLY
jgi:hypothetical protein